MRASFVQPPPFPSRPRRFPDAIHAVLTVVAVLLLAGWAGCWVKSVNEDRFALGFSTWVPPLPFMAGDFKVHIDHVARVHASGVDPYTKKNDWVCEVFPYPPMIPRLFSWVALVSTPTAIRIWLSVLAGVFGTAAYAAWRTRGELGIRPGPLALIIAALVCSTPVFLAMERGQCDPAIILGLLAVAWLLRERTTWREIAAGAVLALAAWVKYYPGLAVVAFPVLGRWRGLVVFVAIAGLIGAIDRTNVKHSIDNGLFLSKAIPHYYPTLAINHSIVAEWRSLGVRRSVPLLRKISPPLAAALLLIPPIALVSRRVARARNPAPLIFPFLLWLTAAATFAMPYSVDYNLVVLPLAALAVWDRRDPIPVQVAMALLLVWWQPFQVPVRGELLFYIKLGGLYAVGASLAARAGESVAATFEVSGQSGRGRFAHARDGFGKAHVRVLLMRKALRGRWPTGAMGMLGLVLAVELYVARHDRDFTTHWAQAWQWSGRAAGTREAKRSQILCFGDSLVLHGVLPNVIEGRLNRRAYNLAVFKGQAPASYLLLRRALASGAKPTAALVDGELFEDDPLDLPRLWPELASYRDCVELAWTARSPRFFAAMAVAKVLPSYKARWEIRSSVVAALGGQTGSSRTEIRLRQRNSEQNRGAQVLPLVDGPDPRAGHIAGYLPAPWKSHPLNADFADKFLALAGSRGIPVYWLLPPYYPGIQDRREAGGWDAAYMAFLRRLQARHANLVVIDGRHAGYAANALFDLTHLNRVGAVAFSDSVAGVLRDRLEHPSESPNRWVEIPAYRPPLNALDVEDVVASSEAIKQKRMNKTKVRR